MPAAPTVIGKYRVVRHIGDGGMGAVYLGHDDDIDREVAIKLLRADDGATRRRFQSEAQSAGRLKHANIVTVYEYGEFEGGPYLAMEYIEGSTLAQLIDRREPHSVSEKLGVLIQACQGLAYAHRFGVTHRDIKPSNLMVDHDGVVKIVDFGIARTSGRDLTVTGKVVGTPAYMSPEQIQGAPTDHRCDIFAMGIVVFEMLSGQVAFSGDSDYAVINRIVNGTPNTFSHPDTKVERLMQPVLAKALAVDPDRRYQSANELAADLTRVRGQVGPSTATSGSDSVAKPAVLLPVPNRRPWVAAAAAAIAVGVVAVGAWILWPRTIAQEDPAIQPPRAEPQVQTLPTVPAAETVPVTPPPTPPPVNRPATTQAAKPVAEPQSVPKGPAPAADGERINSRLETAKSAEGAGNFDTAIAIYLAILADQPNHTAAAEGVASARRAQTRAREAVMKARLAEGEQKLGDGAYDDAVAIFESVLKQDADNVEAASGIARARKAQAAEEALFKARKKPPGSK
jgi:serine/threonine-protein kinase